MFKITRPKEFKLTLVGLARGIQAEINEETRPMHVEALIQLRDATHGLVGHVALNTLGCPYVIIKGKNVSLAARLLRVAGFKLTQFGVECY